MRKGVRVYVRVAAAAAGRGAAPAAWLRSLPAETSTGRRIVVAERLLFDFEGPQAAMVN
jgi:hypothetical protein